MLGIIANHAVVHGGAENLVFGETKLFAFAFLPLDKIWFTCFLAINMWFLVDSRFKGTRFIKIWLEVLFHTFLMTFLTATLSDTQLTPAKWVSSLLPIAGSSHGFAAAYLAFYLFLPLLHKATDRITRAQAGWVLFLLFCLAIVEKALSTTAFANIRVRNNANEFLLFLMCYFLLLILKRWPLSICKDRLASGGIFFAAWAITLLAIP